MKITCFYFSLLLAMAPLLEFAEVTEAGNNTSRGALYSKLQPYTVALEKLQR